MLIVLANMAWNLHDVTARQTSARRNQGINAKYLCTPSSPLRKRKRLQDSEEPQDDTTSKELWKRARRSVAAEETLEHHTSSGASEDDKNPIGHWTRHRRWPKEYFEQGSNMSYLIARKKSATSLGRKKSDSSSVTPSSTTPSDEKPREAKSAPYARSSYATILATKGSFMDESERDITDTCKSLCSDLLESEQTPPLESLFRDDLFKTTCRKIRDRNETIVIRDIALLIVPSAQTLATYGAAHLERLTESVNEGWNSAIPIYGPRPQSDYSVGFGRYAFTDDQLEKLKPFVGDIAETCTSYFMATWRMYFPFLTCEVKCGAAALDIADRQNAHSMTIAVRAVVELFRYVKREKEVDGEILAFSISHDHSVVRIYGHYAVIDGAKTMYYRHSIRKFDFTEMDGREKWTAYKFTRNVYDIWMPKHFQRICSAIHEFPPDVNFDVSQQSELQCTEGSGLSRDVEFYSLAQSSAGSGSAEAQADSQSSVVDAQDITPNTSLTTGGAFKRPRTERGGRKRR
ncbi:hypothetical protein LTR78_010963 [Recurvomyces mirabilis]|uniref:DUF7924 domain-containing protein n=1 Tax=Recurvomyces mirabilis TaxID=574656 RepID=A0AAE0WGL5_9PEZI|nr:hypothetical protein LTR78_010963 [Recurvomyces mirabilis]KAK5149556.1 hypothetical protein LTS14_010850 [Recurvomyces mirabilis]